MLSSETAEELRETLLPHVHQIRNLGHPAQLTDEIATEAAKAALRVEVDLAEATERINARLASIEATQDSILAILQGTSKPARRTRGKAD